MMNQLPAAPHARTRSAHRSGVLLIAIACLISGCRGRHSRTEVKNEEADPAPRVASVMKMSDAAANEQLLHGFYALEGGAWRWTAGSFTVLLRPPLAAAQRGATLRFSFSFPEVSQKKLQSVVLTAMVGGTKLKSETYSKAGPAEFIADVPGELLGKETVTFDFKLDKSMKPGDVDQRELGLIATAIALESK